MDTYPHVFFTSPDEWDPSVLDHDPPHLDGLDPNQVPDQPFGDPMFDAYGDFNERIIANLNTLSDNIRKWGAMDTLISDGGKYEISKRVTDLLISSIPYSSKIISLNLITNTKIRLKITLDLPSITPTLS